MICFFDTNILVYTVDSSEPIRRERALECLSGAVQHHTVVISTQVLQEFYSITTRKLRPPLSASQANHQVEQLCGFEVLGATKHTVLSATVLAQAHQLSWWDALILEAALRAQADVLYTEDGQHGRQFGKLRVVNPFLE